VPYYETETESIFGLHDSYITDGAGNGAAAHENLKERGNI